MKRRLINALLCLPFAFAQPLAAQTQETAVSLSLALHRLIVQARGLQAPALFLDDSAQAAAGKYALELAQTGILSHEDSLGRRILERYRAENGSAIAVSEILAYGPSLESAVQAWEASKTHAAALHGSEWTAVGAGAAAIEKEGQKLYIAVAVFTSTLFENIIITPKQNGFTVQLYPYASLQGPFFVLAGSRRLATVLQQDGSYQFFIQTNSFEKLFITDNRNRGDEISVP